MKSTKLVFHHDSNELDYINAFQRAIKPFGLYVLDVTKEDAETLEVIVSNEAPKEPDKEWDC